MSMIDLGTTRLELPNGYWIDVRNQLTARERKRTNAVAMKGQTFAKDSAGATITDTNALADASFYRAAAYVTGWNIRDGEQAWPLTVDGFGNLPEAIFDAIDAALTTHIEACEAAAKNATSASAKN